MAVPHLVIAAGWIPFLIAVIVIILFAIFYIRYYQSRFESEVCSVLSSIAGLAVILMVCALLPVDIFLVSFMKTPEGEFKDWAADKDARESIQNAVLYTYYVLYGIVLMFVFLLLPFAYFFYEEGDEHEPTPVRRRICTGLKYTSVFVVLILALLLIGGLVPFCQLNSCNNSTAGNDTWDVELRNLVGDFQKNGWKDAISFSISFLTMIGFALVVFYTSAGMAIWPLVFIRGVRSPFKERDEVVNARKRVQEQIDKLRSRYRRGERLSRRDQRAQDGLEEEEQLLSRQERHLALAERSCVKRCGRCLWPLFIVVGCVLFVVAILILLTLILTK